MRFSAIWALALAMPASLAAQTDGPNSRYTLLNECRQVAYGEVEDGNDWIAYRCEGLAGIPVWLTYADSARSYLGFGKRKNESGMYDLRREESWPLEWRGRQQEGTFRPFAVIVRMIRPAAGVPTDGQSQLFVYRLRGDGTSCLIASDIASNEVARAKADASLDRYVCEEEPNLPD